jgi:Basic region leucine zipper
LLKGCKNSYINGIKELADQYKLETLDMLTHRGLGHVHTIEDDSSEDVSLRKLKNRESAKNSRKRRKLYIELMERKVGFVTCILNF